MKKELNIKMYGVTQNEKGDWIVTDVIFEELTEKAIRKIVRDEISQKELRDIHRSITEVEVKKNGRKSFREQFIETFGKFAGR